MKEMLLIFILRMVSFTISVQVPPTWLSSEFVKVDSAKVIDGYSAGQTIGAGRNPTATMAFYGTAFTQIPNLGYGVSQYVGKYTVIIGSDSIIS